MGFVGLRTHFRVLAQRWWGSHNITTTLRSSTSKTTPWLYGCGIVFCTDSTRSLRLDDSLRFYTTELSGWSCACIVDFTRSINSTELLQVFPFVCIDVTMALGSSTSPVGSVFT